MRQLLLIAAMVCAHAQIGVFNGHHDVGTVLHAGAVVFDPAAHTYTVSGSGENMWFAVDDFQFVWVKMSGDVQLTANASILDRQGDPHRKAVLMMRQSLDADAPYADVALHGDGLTSLQYRLAAGETTHEIESNELAPKRLRIEKRGDTFTMWIGGEDGAMHFAGGSIRVPFDGPFYVGIGVCAHNKDEVRRAVFSGVELAKPAAEGKAEQWSTLETITVASTDARVALAAPGLVDSPGWSADGSFVQFRRAGKTERVALTGGKPEVADDAPAAQDAAAPVTSDGLANGPARISPDGKHAAFLSRSDGDDDTLLRIMSLEERKVTTLCHFSGRHEAMDVPAWSPDGKRLAFVSYQPVP